MAREWREVIGRRNRTSKTKRLYEDDQPTNKFSWDGMVGTSLHYEEAGDWLEVDPRIVPSSEPGWDWEMQKSHWRFLVRNGGWFAAEKKGVGIGFRLERIAYLNIVTKDWQTIRTANYTTPTVDIIEHGNNLLVNPLGKLTWANLFPGVDFEIHISGDRLHEEIKVSQAAKDAMPAPPYPAADTYLVMVYQVDWGQVPGLADDDGNIDPDSDFERETRLYLKNHQGEIITALPASRAWPEGHPLDEDGEPIEVLLRKRFVKIAGQHYLLVGAPVLALNALPEGILIFDPDVDEQIVGDNDDCYRQIHPSGWALTGEWGWGGDFNEDYYDYRAGFRFTGIGVAQGSAIDTAHLTLTAKDQYGNIPATIIEGEAIDNASEFSTAEDYDGRDRTSAFVSWTPSGWITDAEYDSSEIKTVIQEIVSRDGWVSGYNLVLFWRDADGYGGSQALISAYNYGVSSTKCAKLHIEYTAGAEGNPWYYYAQQQ